MKKKEHGNKNRKWSEQHKMNMGKAQRGLIKFPNGREFTEEHRNKIIASNNGQIRLSKRGEKSSRWKGGIRKHQNGYISILNREHPSGQIYILEHRLVMEKFLGRVLYNNEHIHHKNGVRNDNRIENLELWVDSHPYGIRAKDAYLWAKEIINRYEKFYEANN